MSLLDDVSIVVTPNGYKAGELYAVIPVPTEGAEQVTNGDFATDSYWTKQTGWTISGGTANYDFLSDAKYIRQTLLSGGFVVGKTYKINFEVTSGSAYMYFNSNGGSLISIATYEIGSYSIEVSPANNGSDILIYGRNTSGTAFSIDNVSVKEYTSADMDVTRATAATRVDENGLVNYAEIVGDSILTGNNSNFDTGIGSWVSYNGGTLAHSTDKLEVTLTTGESGAGINTNSLISGGQAGKVFKVRAKIWQGTSTNSTILIYMGASQKAITISSTPTYFDIELTPSNTGSLYIYRSGGSGGVGTFFIDNVSVKEVTRDNVPRIDYTGGGCPHILAEPQRRNLVTYSEVISNLSLLTGGAGTYTITDNYTNSPEGVQNASRVQMSIVDTNDGANYSLIALNSSMTNGVTREISFYAKSLTGLNQEVLVYWSTAKQIVTLTNDWQRFEISATSDNSGAVLIGTRGGTTQYYAGGDANLDFALWGLQVEDDGSGGGSSYATSYIPTSGSTVTRNQDIFTRDGIGSLINSTEGVLFVEIAFSDAGRLAILNSDASDDQVVLGFSGTVFCRIRENGANVVTQFVSSANQLNTYYKIAVKYKSGSSAIWVDGNETVVAGTFTLNDLSKILFISEGSRTYGKVKQLQVYTTALTDTQLAALTS